MARRRRSFENEPAIPEEELSWRMGSSAGRRLEERLRSTGWSADQDAEPESLPDES